MTRTVSATAAKAGLAALMGAVEVGGEPIIIERRGRPVVALVRVDDLHPVTDGPPGDPPFRGFLTLVGAWADASEGEIDAFLEAVYSARESDQGRAVALEP